MELIPSVAARSLGALLAAVALAVGLQAHEGVQAGSNLYRYDVARSGASPACEFDYVELGASARTLPLPARGRAEADDGAAVLPFQRPFELYQVPHEAFVVSANGYLAAAGSLEAEDGGDFGNDCPLPQHADNAAAVQERIYVYHDDLRARRDGGQVRHAFFRECPRPGAGERPEACTVIEWNGFERSGPLLSTQPLRAQAVLYHDTRQVALQYAAIDDSRAASATIGLQGFGGRAASPVGCNTPDTVRPRQAVCFFDPRYPPRR